MDWLKNVNEYMRLGLELGLSYTSLNKIRMDQDRKVDDCKRSLLQLWLGRADRVDEMGGTNKPTLVAALRRMGEHRVADSIISGLRCGYIYWHSTLTQLFGTFPNMSSSTDIACMDNILSYVLCRLCSPASCSCG